MYIVHVQVHVHTATNFNTLMQIKTNIYTTMKNFRKLAQRERQSFFFFSSMKNKIRKLIQRHTKAKLKSCEQTELHDRTYVNAG